MHLSHIVASLSVHVSRRDIMSIIFVVAISLAMTSSANLPMCFPSENLLYKQCCACVFFQGTHAI